MIITIDSLIIVASVISAAGAIIAVAAKLIRWVDRQKKQDAELQAIRNEPAVLVYGLQACLDGLKQLGADGNVEQAKNRLSEHLNKAAHITDQ